MSETNKSRLVPCVIQELTHQDVDFQPGRGFRVVGIDDERWYFDNEKRMRLVLSNQGFRLVTPRAMADIRARRSSRQMKPIPTISSRETRGEFNQSIVKGIPKPEMRIDEIVTAVETLIEAKMELRSGKKAKVEESKNALAALICQALATRGLDLGQP